VNDTGRSEKVFGKECPEWLLSHEVAVTEAELLLGGIASRNPRVGDTTADALLIRNGRRFYVEIDNQTETGRQLRQKFQRYRGVRDIVLVVCRTKARLRTIIRNAGSVKEIALFTRFRWLRSPVVKRIWLDSFGERGTI
jgi:hypothetical protein